MPVITIRVRGPIQGKLKKIREVLVQGGAGQRRLVFAVGRAVLVKVYEAFKIKSEGGTDESGLKWKPLADYTIALKKSLKRRKPSISLDILEETGKLLKSLTPPTQTAVAPARRTDQVFRIEKNAVVVGTSRAWARANHEGRPNKKPPLPQRRLWPETERWPRSWWRAIAEVAKMEIVQIIIRILQGR